MSVTQRALVGAFVGGGILLFAVGLFLIGDRRLLFVDRYELFTTYGRVTGVQIGTGVRVAGLDAGEVTEVVIPPGPEERFRVRMRIRADLQQLVRTDSIASVQTDGLVGNTFIQISGGTEAAPVAPPGSTIQGRDPIEFSDLIQEGRDTFRTVTAEFIALRGDLSETLNSFARTLDEANALIADVGTDAKAITTDARRATADIAAITEDARVLAADVRAGRGTLGKFLREDDVWNATNRLADQSAEAVTNIREVTARLREAIDRLTASGGPSERLVSDLSEAVESAREVMTDLAETTEAAKRHWLVRGFFERRGFFDLDALTVDEYRRGALEEGRRAALRVWLEADKLFEGTDEGQRLTDAGRRRLDVAMADLLKYPRDTPLVVEGYSTSAAPAERYLIADARARLVSGYLRQRFRRDPNLVGDIPIGLEAPDAPSGDGRWDGVALAIFVRKDLLASP